jgi:bla regulator protein BlaR1
VYISITASVAGMIILLIRQLAGKIFSPFWKYVMWCLVLAALLLPWRPPSPYAVMDTTERIQEVSFREEHQQARAEYFAALDEAEGGQESSYHESSERLAAAKAKTDTLLLKTLVFDNFIPMLWLCGTILIGLFMLISGIVLSGKIRRSIISCERGRYEAILHKCQRTLGVKRRVRLLPQNHVRTPALFGLFCPKVLLPAYADSMSDEHLKCVVLHELSHLRRGDSVVNTAMLVLQAVYWFNPIIWFLFKIIREDMELANDAAVIKGMSI